MHNTETGLPDFLQACIEWDLVVTVPHTHGHNKDRLAKVPQTCTEWELISHKTHKASHAVSVVTLRHVKKKKTPTRHKMNKMYIVNK